MTHAEVISLGCRLNACEGEIMRRLADEAGAGETVVVNSCAVTAEAVRRSRQAARRARRDRPGARVVVTGCAAQIDPAAFSGMAEVDAVIGNADKLDPAAWRALAGGRPPPVNDIMAVRETAGHLVDGYGDRARAFLQVQNGCDHRCTFCIIPYGRGPSRSVPAATVVESARRLVAAGHAEIVLTGVDLTAWGRDLAEPSRLGDLVGAILDGVPDLARLRLSSIDGAEIDAALFERIAGEPRLAPHLHLSLQAGSDMILKRMKRRHRRADAIELCASVRAARPDIAFGADLIAGFPTETEAMFEESLSLIDEAGVSYVHAFPFSARNGTPAARMPQLPGEVVRARARRLREKAAAALARFLGGLVGDSFDAVVEAGGRARLGNFAPVRLAEPGGTVGGMIRLRVLAREGDGLVGRVL